MKRLSFDTPTVMSLLTVLGMVLATAGTWPPAEGLAVLRWPGLALVYLAGGLPATGSALLALWRQHVLDIDLLMVVAAVAAAVVGAPFEGAVLLTLFSVSTTLEHQALGRARRAVEALMALRPETAFRRQADGSVLEVPAAELVVGDVVILRPGARVPADGVWTHIAIRGRNGGPVHHGARAADHEAPDRVHRERNPHGQSDLPANRRCGEQRHRLRTRRKRSPARSRHT
jgi:Cd2+/Zn2+-exporting ATPase